MSLLFGYIFHSFGSLRMAIRNGSSWGWNAFSFRLLKSFVTQSKIDRNWCVRCSYSILEWYYGNDVKYSTREQRHWKYTPKKDKPRSRGALKFCFVQQFPKTISFPAFHLQNTILLLVEFFFRFIFVSKRAFCIMLNEFECNWITVASASKSRSLNAERQKYFSIVLLFFIHNSCRTK